MKKITNIFAVIAIAAMIAPVINSCKKGPEDPFLSMRSRDKRVEGTWTLKTVDYTYTKEEKTATTNTVNSDTENETETWTNTVSYDGTSMKTTSGYTSNETDNYKLWNGQSFTSPVYDAKTKIETENKAETWTKSYTITVSIYKDNTYKYTVTEKATSYTRAHTKTTDGVTDPGYPNDTSYAGTYEGGMYYANDEQTKTEYGTWTWEDELGKSSKDKIAINAGPLSGYLARLSNKELIIDYAYPGIFTSGNFFIDPTWQNQTTDDNTVKAQTYTTYRNSYSSTNPSDFTTGTATSTTTTTTKVVSGKSTWEKTDKKRKREDGEAEE